MKSIALASTRFTAKNVAFILLAVVVVPVALALNDLAETKLQGRWPNGLNTLGFQQGRSVALSDKWVLVGAPVADVGTLNEGDVQVFNAITGAWVRLLRPPAPIATNSFFGTSVAISGDLAIIGAPGANATHGSVSIYNLTTGAFVRGLQAGDGVAGDNFGYAVAAGSGKVLVGAPNATTSEGSVYAFDLATGAALLPKLKVSSPASLEYFGNAIAIDGNFAVIGLPGRNVARGAAAVFDLTMLTELLVIVPSGSTANDSVGESVALSQGVVCMSAPNHNAATGAVFTYDLRSSLQHMLVAGDGLPNDLLGSSTPSNGVATGAGMVLAGAYNAGTSRGAAYLFDLHTGLQIRRLQPSDSAVGAGFGSAMAMWGNAAVIGSFIDSSPIFKLGSAYLFKPLTTAMPLTKLTAKSDFAPGTAETSFGTLGDAFLNYQGEIALGAKLAGLGSHGGTDAGVWATLGAGAAFDLSAASGSFLNPAFVATTGAPIINQANHALYPATLKIGSGGVTALNNKTIVVEDGSSAVASFHSGQLLFLPDPSALKDFTEITQSISLSADQYAATFTLADKPVAGTGILIFDFATSAYTAHRNGGTYAPNAGLRYGQFTGRVAFNYDRVVFSSATNDVPANNAVIVQQAFNVMEVEVARKGLQAPVLGGPLFSAFLGETADCADRVLYRATVAGAGITAANNEGLWTRTTAGLHGLALRKGANTGLPVGVNVAKIIQYWGVHQGAPKIMALVQLTGTGVTAANDQALLLVQEDNSLVILLREGQSAPGCGTATIGTISRIEADTFAGYYAVLTTLVGAVIGTDQALFTGKTSLGNTTTHVTMRRPTLLLRKGELYDNQPSKIKSISLPLNNTTASGAGGTGRGRAIAPNGKCVLTVEFENGVRQVMKGSL